MLDQILRSEGWEAGLLLHLLFLEPFVLDLVVLLSFFGRLVCFFVGLLFAFLQWIVIDFHLRFLLLLFGRECKLLAPNLDFLTIQFRIFWDQCGFSDEDRFDLLLEFTIFISLAHFCFFSSLRVFSLRSTSSLTLSLLA